MRAAVSQPDVSFCVRISLQSRRSARMRISAAPKKQPEDGETIGRRIRINQPDDENVRCKVSGASVQHRDFSPFTQQPTTRSTFNAISFQQGRTALFEPRPWTHGVRPLLQHEHDYQRDHSRLSFDNVTKPSGAFFKRHFSADCTINIFGFNFPQGQP